MKILYFIISLLFSLIILNSDANASYSSLYISEGPETDFEVINFCIPDEIEDGWYPLREISNYLPFDISWDEETKTIIIESELLKNNWNSLYQSYKEFNVSKVLTLNSITILDGVTYCSPQFIDILIYGLGFTYNNEVWYCNAEDNLDGHIKAAMLEIEVKAPEEYDFITSLLTGGIAKAEIYYPNALGYVYSHDDNPVCYIIDESLVGLDLAMHIGHEAYHVYQARNNIPVDEQGATEYEYILLDKLTKAP